MTFSRRRNLHSGPPVSSGGAGASSPAGASGEGKAPRPTGMKRFWVEWMRPLTFVLLALWAFRSTVADWNDVPTGSMEPTILTGDRIAVNKLAYDLKLPFTDYQLWRWSGPARGDVIVFYSEEGVRLVKRVVAVPGDRIEMRDKQLLISGEAVKYDWFGSSKWPTTDPYAEAGADFATEHLPGGAHPIVVFPQRHSMANFGPTIVPSGHYFVMGDNRDNSRDSRVFGFVPRERIVGRAFGVALSFDRTHNFSPRWERFFRSLP